MNREQKKVVVENFEKLFKESAAAFLVNYKGISVSEMQVLRSSLRKDNGLLKITKARLMKIAAKNKAVNMSSLEEFQSFLKEQVGIVFSQSEDVTSIAKKLVHFSKESEKLKIISGIFENRILLKDEVEFLATIPSKEVLIVMLLGVLQTPIISLVRLLNQLITKLLHVLKEIEKQKGIN